ncbi:phosphoenolpyruvate mutase [Paraburkholderia denitrificans]|uniref:phosphoenolpyruvate mutase n=1 Tax=Paraburkholderia denitrificans TaxID=694025 RepID=A0ABW0J6Z1_9BURK
MITSASTGFEFSNSRGSALRIALERKKCLRIMEVSSPLAALVVETSKASDEAGRDVEYDGFWSSSLTDSTSRGKPDIEILDVRSRIHNIQEILESTRKPLIIDADTGGKPEHFTLNVIVLENSGVSAAIIEDKTGLKKNSLLGACAAQIQEHPADFCRKIELANQSRRSKDFMIVARVESLVLERGMDDALSRAHQYVEAGADGIMIHSKSIEPLEILEFSKRFRVKNRKTPLVCVPTTYNCIRFSELEQAGFNVVIYANHLLRAAYPAMVKVAEGILQSGRSLEVEGDLFPIDKILRLIPGTI